MALLPIEPSATVTVTALEERLAENLNAAIETRHNVVHRRPESIFECTDDVCSAYSELRTAVG